MTIWSAWAKDRSEEILNSKAELDAKIGGKYLDLEVSGFRDTPDLRLPLEPPRALTAGG
jgi:hypothetical protein